MININSLPKLVSGTALVLSLTILSSTLPAAAQTTPTNTGTENNSTTYRTTTSDRDFDWGWLGLLGLIGLANL